MKGTKRSRGENGFEEWGGYMNAKITKLEEQFDQESKAIGASQKLSEIFKGISIFVNGYTIPSADELKKLMILHGGTFHHYETDRTTFTIASNLPNAKIKLLKSKNFVKPEWIVDCIKLGKMVDYKNYLLFVNSVQQPALNFKTVDGTNPLKVKPLNSVAKTATDPEFLNEFYNNSRLHHISTMGTMFKQYITELQNKHDGTFIGRDRILKWIKSINTRDLNLDTDKRTVMHIDMDCFFVSVALRNNIELVGHPVAVTHAKGNPTHKRNGTNRKFEFDFWHDRAVKENDSSDEEFDSKYKDTRSNKNKIDWNENISMSEVASCSYEARAAGVKNGMLLGVALKLCPNLKTVPYDFDGYKEVSFALYDTVTEYTFDIEAVSCDELFIDCTELLTTTKLSPLEFAEFLRKEIKEKTGCPSSAGIGSNKLLARLATKFAKPNGQYYIKSENVREFMKDVNVSDLPGVGRSWNHKLKSLGVTTCQELQDIQLDVLKKEFGNKNGETLYKYCRGEDERIVNNCHQRKSVSAEVNYGIRFTTKDEALNFFKQLSQEVSNRLKDIKMKGKCITFKVMVAAKDAPVETAKFLGHGACDYITKSVSVAKSFDDPELILKNVTQIYNTLNIPPNMLRGIGIQITKLTNEENSASFGLHKYLKPFDEISEKTTVNNKQTKDLHEGLRNRPAIINKPKVDEIDLTVLLSLPDNIKNEILAEYGLKIEDLLSKPGCSKNNESHQNELLSVSQIDTSVFESLPDDIQNEIKNCLDKKENKKISSLHDSLSINEFRELIGEWVHSEMEPKNCDIEMVTEYLQQLVINKQLHNLNLLIRCLTRHVSKIVNKYQVWRNVYDNIILNIQESMMKIYKGKLYIENLF